MDPFRSLLFIPANNAEWVVETPRNVDADGFIYDLEDSVPPGEKVAARETLREAYDELADLDALVTARVNPPETGLFEHDLEAIVHERLDAVFLPKGRTAADVRRAHHVLEYLEEIRGIDEPVELILVPETAEGMYNAYELCTASDRVAAIGAGTSPGADVARSLNWEWTEDGHEKLHMLSKVNMEGRAAGLTEIMGGVWVDIEDLGGLRREAQWLRELGYTGYHVIHPSHVEPVNEIFTPDRETVDRYRRLTEELDRAELEEGRAAVEFEGEMIDIAHLKTAERVLDRARAFGIVD